MEREAFEALFAAHHSQVVRYVQRRVGDLAVAEDIAAETFVVAWSKSSAAEITQTWLYRTAWHKIHDHDKRSRRKHRAVEALAREVEGKPAPLTALERMMLADAMRLLSARECEIVMLTYWEHLSAGEIGEIVGISEPAVWTALSRARAKLRDHVGGSRDAFQGGDHAAR